MSKARLWNTAIELSKSENLFFLDDDNYFISINSISTILELLDKYEVVFGQIQDKSGRFRNFESNRVQGTTFGIKKSVINDINGFGEWTEKTSCGIDSDLWLKLYNHFKNNNEFKACFTNSIQTIDSFSKRWKPFINTFFRHRLLKNQFYKEHGCHNYQNVKDNPSREKSNWIMDLSR